MFAGSILHVATLGRQIGRYRRHPQCFFFFFGGTVVFCSFNS